MKSTNLIAATLSIAAIAAATTLSPAARAQNMNKPMVQTDPATGKPIVMVPMTASMIDKYKMSWSYRNLDAVEVKRYRSEGFSDSTIRGAANIALNTGLELPFVLRQVREVGVPLYTLAAEYGLSTRTVDSDVPGYGLESISITPAMPSAMPAPSVMTTPSMTGTVSSASMSAPTTMATPIASPVAQGSIVDVVMGNPDLSTLVSAIKAANLVDTLSGPGPYTVFAPTNEAFAKLPAGTLDDLMKPENQGKLRSILTYHVIAGKVMASDVMAMTNPSMPTTLNGATLNVKTTAPVMINGANVTQTDIVASNGVIHIIDTVLMPPTTDAATPAVAPAPPAPAR